MVKRLFHFKRKLQVDIVTLFLSLLVVSVSLIIYIPYKKNNEVMLDLAEETIDRVSLNVRDQILCLIHDVSDMPLLLASFVPATEDISLKNEDLISFMLTAVKLYPNLSVLFIGTPEGSFIEAIDLTALGTARYVDSGYHLPEGALYAVRVIDRTHKPLTEIWYYKDEHFKTLGKESFETTFDPRSQEWYLGVEKSGRLYWTDAYTFDPTGDPGMVEAMPIYDKQGKLMSILGTDLIFRVFSTLFEAQKVSPSGQVFLINPEGKIEIPLDASNPRALEAYRYFSQTQDMSFILKSDHGSYLAHVRPFPVPLQKDWLVVITAPLNDFFGKIIKAREKALVISLIIFAIAGLIAVYFSKRISKPIVALTHEVDRIQHLDLGSETRVHSAIHEISLLDASIAAMRVTLRSFGRYVPKAIVKQLMERGQEIALGGEKKEVTIFFSDIADFTPIAESLPIEEVMEGLAAYFKILSTLILENQGTIDKYIGDSVMAFWGAPTEMADHAEKGCEAALLCQSRLKEFNLERKNAAKPPFFTRIGIHTGEVIVGNIGTKERMNYTVMGDVVNATARLQQVDKIYHTFILISEEVNQKIGERFLTRPLDVVSVKGKQRQIKVYELVAQHGGETSIAPTPDQMELCQAFTQAYEAYSLGHFDEAKRLFNALSSRFPDDFPTQMYLERLKR